MVKFGSFNQDTEEPWRVNWFVLDLAVGCGRAGELCEFLAPTMQYVKTAETSEMEKSLRLFVSEKHDKQQE